MLLQKISFPKKAMLPELGEHRIIELPSLQIQVGGHLLQYDMFLICIPYSMPLLSKKISISCVKSKSEE